VYALVDWIAEASSENLLIFFNISPLMVGPRFEAARISSLLSSLANLYQDGFCSGFD